MYSQSLADPWGGTLLKVQKIGVILRILENAVISFTMAIYEKNFKLYFQVSGNSQYIYPKK